MPLRGRAFLPMWFGVAEEFGAEFERWHTVEHMPERLGIPGFRRGRRYVDARTGRPGFQLYEAAHIETFRSPGYLARLNAPTPWSIRIQPHVTGFIRGACQVVVSLGEGVGGALLTVRFVGDGLDRPEIGHSLATAATMLVRLNGVTSVHVGYHQPDIASEETAETRLRGGTGTAFNFVLLIEGISDVALRNALDDISEIASVAERPCEVGLYRLAYLLEDCG